MNKWVKIGAGLLLLAWAPFLYAELSSDGPEQPERELPTDKVHDDSTAVVQPIEPEEEPKAEAPAAEPAAAPEPEEAPDPSAEAVPAVPAAPAAVPPADQVAQLAPQPGQAAPGALAANDPAADPNAPEGDEVAAAEGEEEEPEPTPPATSGPAEALKQAYEQQPRDALWAADAEAKIHALYAGDDIPDGLLHAASCRKAVCRVELRWTKAGAAAYVSTYESAQKLLGGEVGVEPVGQPSDKGDLTVNLYLTRKGYTLADLSR